MSVKRTLSEASLDVSDKRVRPSVSFDLPDQASVFSGSTWFEPFHRTGAAVLLAGKFLVPKQRRLVRQYLDQAENHDEVVPVRYARAFGATYGPFVSTFDFDDHTRDRLHSTHTVQFAWPTEPIAVQLAAAEGVPPDALWSLVKQRIARMYHAARNHQLPIAIPGAVLRLFVAEHLTRILERVLSHLRDTTPLLGPDPDHWRGILHANGVSLDRSLVEAFPDGASGVARLLTQTTLDTTGFEIDVRVELPASQVPADVPPQLADLKKFETELTLLQKSEQVAIQLDGADTDRIVFLQVTCARWNFVTHRWNETPGLLAELLNELLARLRARQSQLNVALSDHLGAQQTLRLVDKTLHSLTRAWTSPTTLSSIQRQGFAHTGKIRFDQKQHLLPFANGVLEWKGPSQPWVFRPLEPDDYVSRIIPINYIPSTYSQVSVLDEDGQPVPVVDNPDQLEKHQELLDWLNEAWPRQDQQLRVLRALSTGLVGIHFPKVFRIAQTAGLRLLRTFWFAMGGSAEFVQTVDVNVEDSLPCLRNVRMAVAYTRGAQKVMSSVFRHLTTCAPEFTFSTFFCHAGGDMDFSPHLTVLEKPRLVFLPSPTGKWEPDATWEQDHSMALLNLLLPVWSKLRNGRVHLDDIQW